MKKVVRLTERDLTRLVKKVINEDKFDSSNINEFYGGEMEDSMVPIIDRVINKLGEIKDEMSDINRGTYNREDMIKIEFIDGLLRGEDMKLLLKSYQTQMKYRFH
jgi:hypothetical protein